MFPHVLGFRDAKFGSAVASTAWQCQASVGEARWPHVALSSVSYIHLLMCTITWKLQRRCGEILGNGNNHVQISTTCHLSSASRTCPKGTPRNLPTAVFLKLFFTSFHRCATNVCRHGGGLWMRRLACMSLNIQAMRTRIQRIFIIISTTGASHTVRPLRPWSYHFSSRMVHPIHPKKQ